MRHSEYERRRRALEEQCRADLELVRAAYEAKIRALEMLWLVAPEAGVLTANPTNLLSGETSPPEEPPSRQALHLPEPPAPPVRRQRGQTQAEIEATLPSLPEVFNKEDVIQALGYEPSRPTLNRAFVHLLHLKRIVMEMPSIGNEPTRYRRLPDADENR
jgi:hypothetical protein